MKTRQLMETYVSFENSNLSTETLLPFLEIDDNKRKAIHWFLCLEKLKFWSQ